MQAARKSFSDMPKMISYPALSTQHSALPSCG